MRIFLGLSAVLALGANGPAPVPVCSLITQDEAAAALGSAVPAGRRQELAMPLPGRTGHADICFFGTEVRVIRFEMGGGAANLFAQYRTEQAGRNDGATALTGIGDEAFHSGGQITFRKGQTAFVVDVGQNRGGGARELATEKRLALLVLSRS